VTLTEFLNKWGPGRVEAMGDDLTAVVTEATRISKWRVREIEAAAAARALATDAAISAAIEAKLARVTQTLEALEHVTLEVDSPALVLALKQLRRALEGES
jgi:hypothetical protein